MIELVTWNVLHRIHAVNWREPVIDAHPDEAARIAQISAVISSHRTRIVCLQEVSGDQLSSLRAAFPVVLASAHARVPRLRSRGADVLGDPGEYLVTIAEGGALDDAETFSTDDGKGFHAVRTRDALILNTHVSFGAHHAAQCAHLAAYAGAHGGVVVITGDFNADEATTLRHLGGGFVIGRPPPGARPTRPRATPSDKSQTIDHVVVTSAATVEVDVLDGRGLSDHNPVVARIAPR